MRFTMTIAAWWLQASNKLSVKQSKKQPENSEIWTTPGADLSKI